jgi:hypothetical protein
MNGPKLWLRRITKYFAVFRDLCGCRAQLLSALETGLELEPAGEQLEYWNLNRTLYS